MTLNPFVFSPMTLAIEGSAIGFIIAIPVGPAAALCIRRAIAVGALAGYLTGVGAAAGDAVFGAVAAFGLSFVEQFVARNEAWLRGIGGIVLMIMGIATMKARTNGADDPVKNDREHKIATHFHYFTSSFALTVFNPITVMAFGAAFAGRNLAGVGANLADAALLVGAVFVGALAWWAILCTGAVSLRTRFSGAGMRWLSRTAGAVILGFGAVALISLLPLPWQRMGLAFNV